MTQPIVAVIGLGKLGLPMAAAFASQGFDVFGVDNRPEHIQALQAGECPIQETDLAVYLARSGERIDYGLDAATAVEHADLSFVILPTPSGKDGAFRNDYVEAVLPDVARGLQGAADSHRFHTVVITSTVMPGSMRGFQDRLEQLSGLRMGEDFGLCYSPEFIALGSVIRNFLNPDFVLIGAEDLQSARVLDGCYAHLFGETHGLPRVPRALCNFPSAELAKLSLNSYVTMKVAFANEIGTLCERVPGADVDRVLGAIGLDHRIGGKYLKAGTPFGGPCFPRDGRALRAVARERDICLDLSLATDRVNQELQTAFLHEALGRALPKNAPIVILGLTYKAGTPVTEEACGSTLLLDLVRLGYTAVRGHDPLTQPADLEAMLITARLIFYLVPQEAYQGLEELLRPGTIVIDPWRALDLARVAAGVHVCQYGVGPHET